jgi:chromosome segregation ATPase
MFENSNRDYEVSELKTLEEELEDLGLSIESLRDEVAGLEANPNVPKSIKELLRHLDNSLQDIQNEVDDFIDSLYGVNNDNF